ncbi:S9 family peptidase [Rhodovibrionaceae bacterium A322]
MSVAPPRPEKRPTHRTVHGVDLQDDYAWLKDENWQEVMHKPEVLQADIKAHLDAENSYTAACLANTQDLQQTLFEELKGRLKEQDDSVPARDGDYAYFYRFVTGGQYPVFVRNNLSTGQEEELLDGNKEAEGEAYFQVGGIMHSQDHSMIAYAVDTKGSEYFEGRIKNLTSGELLPDRLLNTAGGLVWSNDGQFLFYVELDDNHRPCRLKRHKLGSSQDEDVLIFEEKDPGFFLGVDKTESGRFILVDSHDYDCSEVWLIDADAPESDPLLVQARSGELKYEVSHDAARDRLLILTNADGATDFKLVEAPLSAPGKENWTDLVPHELGRYRIDHLLFADHMVLLERVESLPTISITCFSSGQSHQVSFSEAAYSLGLSPGYEYDSHNLRFVFSSPKTPQQTFDYDLLSRKRTLLKTQEVPSGHDPEAYETRRLLAPSHDGALVPVTLLYRKDTPLDGSAPVLLYGYGSYGLATPASFVPNRLSLVDRGFVYAIAHIRGSSDKGYSWYLDGRLEKKRNTFWDFIAAGRHLVAEGLAREGNIAAHGGSAGGMLMGVVVNEAPDLFKAAVADVPFVDVLNTMLDDSLPLTPPEWPQWGNPITDKAAFDYIRSYSPYDNITDQSYPHILATAGLTDPRVTYWEPAKWVARLREVKCDDKLLLLRTYMDAGHAGSAGRFDKLKEVGLIYAFLMKVFDRL